VALAGAIVAPVALVGAVLGPAWAGPEAGRAGRVVRVERPRLQPPEPVRFCIITNPAERGMVCYGRTSPAPGTRFSVLDDSGLRGQVTAREATRAEAYDGCQLGTAHQVTFDTDGADLGNTPTFYQVAIQGVSLERGARLLRDPQIRAPSGRSNEQVWAALDRDGDGMADLLGTAYDCTGEERDLPRAPAGQQIAPLCLDYWLRDQVDWTKVGRDVFLQCH
jgi:hypothetical protein